MGVMNEIRGIESNVAQRWRAEAARPTAELKMRLRLAAMAGHMSRDGVVARRAALIDLLADGRPHTREDIQDRVAADVGAACWGKRPQEALLRDVAALRRGGIGIAYSRRAGLEGYYLKYPAMERRQSWAGNQVADEWLMKVRAHDSAAKNETAFAAAEFAKRQKHLIIAGEHPDWPEEQIDREARRLVYGV